MSIQFADRRMIIVIDVDGRRHAMRTGSVVLVTEDQDACRVVLGLPGNRHIAVDANFDEILSLLRIP